MRHSRTKSQDVKTRTEKYCPGCKLVRPITDYTTSPARNDGRGNWCRNCAAQKGRDSRVKRTKTKKKLDARRMKARTTAWKARDPEGFKLAKRRYYLQHQYKLTPEQLETLLTKQKYQCAICYRPLKAIRKWHIDHCHDTKKIRGILCVACNHLLGCARDNLAILGRATKYLEEE